ncbi:uncharacterized protein LOC117178740 [Belonocnema kinseyi]|uniref:uncharacterized protein LOC117178740 n=1 Tax=Belonocnema kinseyi TaxID=2817044 RepID=UPI00143DF243|nr:uncharacterized protein LOC117178740 [Belonocnema kinseyi]
MIVDSPSATERSRAMNCLLKFAQARDFKSELKDIAESKQVSSRGRLSALNLFTDPAGLLRVGGRLINVPIAFEQKHPIILAPGNPLTLLIIAHEHNKLLHAGCQAVMSSLKTRYWTLSCKTIVKKFIKKCMKCFRAQPMSPEYTMGNLPFDRVSPNGPFLTCGVDYAGLFFVVEKSRSRSVSKAYICIFVCFATNTVHIELARDISTNAFFNCLYRFVSRRGKCKNIHSDNGTNFVGARNELKELGELLKSREFQESVTDFLANEQVTWHMIPSHAPNFGSLWESAVKSAKKQLKIVIGETRLTFEELYTLLTQVEACLNLSSLITNFQ